MPRRPAKRRCFDRNRALRILRLIGMQRGEFVDLLNGKANTLYGSGDASNWFASGRKKIPDSAVVLLKSLVREARLKRDLERYRTQKLSLPTPSTN